MRCITVNTFEFKVSINPYRKVSPKVKRFKRIIICIIAVLTLLSSLSITASADSYTHWYTRDSKRSVEMRDVFESVSEITGHSLGQSNTLDGLNDLYVHGDKLYVLCGDLSKIIVLDREYNVVSEITARNTDGSVVDFTGARGIYVDAGMIMIADTDHARVLVCEPDGTVEKEIGLPDATVIPDTYIYKPIKVVKDQRDYIYVISEGSYYGALLFNSNYEFLSFYGANEAKSSITDILQNLWNRYFATNEQLSKQTKTLPYQFSNFCLGSDGFMYTVTGATELYSTSTGQIIKLSPGGSNVLYSYDTLGEASNASSYNFGELTYLQVFNINQMQSFCDIYVDENSFIYTVDKTYGIVYVYDSNCNLITAFGGGFGSGKTVDTFRQPTAITKFGDDLIISDSGKKALVIFNTTDFGQKLIAAQKMKVDGNYAESKELWEEVLALEPNCQMAYIGLASACLETSEYDKGLEYAKKGQSYDLYSQLYEQISKDFMRKNAVWLVLAVVAVIVLAIFVIRFWRKHRKADLIPPAKAEIIKLPFEMLAHPVNSFTDLKYKNKGSVAVGLVIALVYYITSVLSVTNGGFLFTSFDSFSFNALFTLARTAGLIILWSVANWGICSLLEGKGRLKDVFCVTTYSILPLIFYNIIFLVMSNILPLSAAVFLNGVNVVSLLYTAFLLIVGMITVHEYSFKKFILTSVLTVLGMILVVFIGFVMAILLQQLFNFFVTVYAELVYR